MRWTHTWLLLGIGALGAGCETPPGVGLEIARYATRNLVEAPVDARDDCLERARNRHWAEEAWDTVLREHPGQTYSVHYVQGFRDGFADFLYAGGTGEPPVVPPWRYRRTAYEGTEGYAAVEDWFAGFRHGASSARASGLRELIVVPVALPGYAPHAPPLLPLSTPEEAAAEVLPPPRVLPAPEPERIAPPKEP